jgi:predicted acyltransferase
MEGANRYDIPSMAFPPENRLLSIDAFRGFVMLAMVSGGFAVQQTVNANPDLLSGSTGDAWRTAAYQLSHVPWAGCSFWDLIQPSFMFLVGVSLPFSAQSRLHKNHSGIRLFLHALVRSLILVVLGVVLYSQSQDDSFINFKLVNVLTQIGLGYIFVYLLLHRGLWVHLLAIAAILGGYWYAFYQHTPSAEATANVTQYLTEHNPQRLVREHQTNDLGSEAIAAAVTKETTQYDDDRRSHWNKHTNAAAAFDRWFLNLFPRNEEQWNDKGFWINNGGYQTLNFIPSIATMIFGLIAGLILISDYSKRQKLLRLIAFSVLCFAGAFAMDSELLPVVTGKAWSVCPIVKRIWTPSWALFSAGWTFAILSAFYLVVDVMKLRLWTFPFAIVGMNSIAMYCLAELTPDWFKTMLQKTLQTTDAMLGTTTANVLFGDGTFVAIYQSIAVVVMLWLACFWMYRRKLFVRV